MRRWRDRAMAFTALSRQRRRLVAFHSPPSRAMKQSTSRRRFLGGALTAASTLSLSACGGSNDDNNDDNGSVKASFQHGVASGDPLSDRVILWTRITPEEETSIILDWEVSASTDFSKPLRAGRLTTDAMQDYTAKVDVDGLSPGTRYWYRFLHGDTISPVGRTRTLPTGSLKSVKLAVFSCSNYPAGYFHVYAEAAKREDLDVAIHLGDYIYEYNSEGYASDDAQAMGRISAPANEIVKLQDYRTRYAQYRSDPDLQALHASLAMIAVWDDHEIANDTWMNGAENHQPDTEGDFALRKAAAVRAYHEWLPTRTGEAQQQIYRRFEFGDLLTLHMMDTRVIGRDEQRSYTDYLPALLTNPDTATALQQFLASIAGDLGNPTRQLLGQAQTTWLQQGLQTSKATWQVLGQQVLMGPVHLPLPVLAGLLQSAGQLGDVKLPALLQISPQQYIALLQKQALAPDSLSLEERTILSLPSVPYNLDSWDGYWAPRETVLETARQLDRNLVVLAGDTHNAWASDLRTRDGSAVGVELATSSVSSPGFEEYLGGGIQPEQLAQLLLGLANLNTLPAGSKWAGSLKYADTSRRGYMEVTLTHQEVLASWHFVDTVKQADYATSLGRQLRTLPGSSQRKLLEVA